MSSQEKIAKDFVPIFSASKLGDLCNTIRESTRFRFLKEFKPFSELIPKPPKKTPKSFLSKEEKDEIQNSLDNTINLENLTFDDNKVLDSYKNLIKEENEISFLVQNLLLTDDESVLNEESYITAESDEEKFIQENYIKREKSIHLKSLNAVRYATNMRGRKMEKFILEKINKEKNKNFVQNKSKKYIDFGTFKIVGIIDGICHEEKTILEIKTRGKFDIDKDTITKKEKTQALVYMHMHNCDKCLFIESGPNGERKETLLEYDKNKFENDVVKKLEEFCLFARNLTLEDFNELLKKYSH